jgi:Tat protein translocase TatB subunit
MYLFILESIGTSELILIGIVALIVFGPRKLPEMARMIGKTMADFRRTTNEFKSTWEKEVNIEETGNQGNGKIESPKSVEQTVQREPRQIAEQNSILSPEIKEVSSSDLKSFLESNEQNKESVEVTPQVEPQAKDKRSWL